jgi:hypothetical protein
LWSPPHLFPEKVGKTNPVITMTAQDNQANEHDYKQDQVGKDRDDETEYALLGCGRQTAV